MMLAIAFESIVKLPAFVAVGLFATYSVFDGAADVWHIDTAGHPVANGAAT